MSKRREINLALSYIYKTNTKGVMEAYTMGNYINSIAPQVNVPEPIATWNNKICKQAIQEYAGIIAELNIEEARASKRYDKFVKLIIDRLSERKYQSERELENYFKLIRFDVDKELKLAGYEYD